MKRILFVVALALLLIGSETLAADFNGDGTGDIAIFRDSSGLWAIRDLTRFYFGTTGDLPKPSDWEGNGTDLPAIFRSSSGLWAIRGFSRVYFGSSGDKAKPGDYNGDGTEDIAIFRESSGLWAARDITRVYFGASGDRAIAPDTANGSKGLPVTGQTTCILFGDDGFYEAGAPFRYAAWTTFPAGHYVVMDHNTGLMWAGAKDGEGCNWGQTTDWESAIWFCSALEFAGFTDWRLPNVKELQSIVDYGETDPAIDTAYFSVIHREHWSSTTVKSDTEKAWLVGYRHGWIPNTDKTNCYYFRAVRGGI